MDTRKAKKRAFSAIHSDQGAISDEMNQALDSNYSEINSEIELENGNDTSQQYTDNEMPFTALDDDLTPQIDKEVKDDNNEKPKQKQYWPCAAIPLLLKLLKKTLPKFRKEDAFRNKAQMYIYFSEEMKKQGFELASYQIENKIHALRRTYKMDKVRGKISAYQRDLDQIFGQSFKSRDKDVDTGSDSNSDMQDTNEANIVDPRTARVQREVQRELQKTLVKIATERQQYHSKVLYYLKRKEEREQRREKRAQEKLRLLEAYVKQL